MNNFKDYGFEADFEGIIYEKYITPCNQTFFNGAIWFRPKGDYHYMKPVSWTDKGNTIHYHVQEHYLTSYNLIPIKKEWYEEAMSMFPGAIFKFFSDEISWCRQEFGNRQDCEFSTNTNEEQDLIEMSCCEHNINSSSTFSWWGAWVNRNPDKIIITPKDWFTTGWMGMNTGDIIPPEWIKL